MRALPRHHSPVSMVNAPNVYGQYPHHVDSGDPIAVPCMPMCYLPGLQRTTGLPGCLHSFLPPFLATLLLPVLRLCLCEPRSTTGELHSCRVFELAYVCPRTMMAVISTILAGLRGLIEHSELDNLNPMQWPLAFELIATSHELTLMRHS